jgi:hypothetical protein
MPTGGGQLERTTSRRSTEDNTLIHPTRSTTYSTIQYHHVPYCTVTVPSSRNQNAPRAAGRIPRHRPTFTFCSPRGGKERVTPCDPIPSSQAWFPTALRCVIVILQLPLKQTRAGQGELRFYPKSHRRCRAKPACGYELSLSSEYRWHWSLQRLLKSASQYRYGYRKYSQILYCTSSRCPMSTFPLTLTVQYSRPTTCGIIATRSSRGLVEHPGCTVRSVAHPRRENGLDLCATQHKSLHVTRFCIKLKVSDSVDVPTHPSQSVSTFTGWLLGLLFSGASS